MEDTGEVYHIVQSCMPININVTDCYNNPEGIFYVAVAQREYKQSQFTHEISKQIEKDVMIYYGYIVLIFVIVKLTLFWTLWSWLKSRVTDRMVELTRKINNNEQIEDKNRIQANEYEKNPMSGETSAF